MIRPAFLVWWDGENITHMEPNDIKGWVEVDKRPPDMPITLWVNKYYGAITLPSGKYEVDDWDGVWIQEYIPRLGDEQYIVDAVGETIHDQLHGQPPGLYVSLYEAEDLWEADTNLIMEMSRS